MNIESGPTYSGSAATSSTSYQLVSLREHDDSLESSIENNSNPNLFEMYRSVKISRTQYKNGTSVSILMALFVVSLHLRGVFFDVIRVLLGMTVFIRIIHSFGFTFLTTPGMVPHNSIFCHYYLPTISLIQITFPDNDRDISFGKWLSVPVSWLSFLLLSMSNEFPAFFGERAMAFNIFFIISLIICGLIHFDYIPV